MHFIAHSSYECFGKEGIEIIIDKNLKEYQALCDITDSLYKVVGITALLVCLFWGIITTLCVSCKYRYRIRMHFIRFRYKFCSPFSKNYSYVTAEYHIYISYCSADRQFVQNTLLDEIETIYKLRCCVPDRDLPGCGMYIDNVYEHMSKSELFLILLSRSSFNNPTVKLEQSYAKTLEMREPVNHKSIYICLDDFKHSQRTLDNNICHKWPSNCKNKETTMKYIKYVSKHTIDVLMFLILFIIIGIIIRLSDKFVVHRYEKNEIKK